MEWLIGLGILWFIGTIVEGRNLSGHETKSTSNTPSPADAELQKMLAAARVQREARTEKPAPLASKDAATSRPAHRGAPRAGRVPQATVTKTPIASAAPNEASSKSTRQDDLEAWDEWSKSGVDAFNVDIESPDVVQAKRFLESRGVTSFWHMTHVSNVSGILEDGILSHDPARLNRKIVDISDHSVQQHRTKQEPVYGRVLHEYAPLYINIRNPMLYVRKELKDQLCLLEISLDVLNQRQPKSIVIADGNAASAHTGFSGELKDFAALPWDVLTAEYWTDFTDGKRKRCAEVLVHPLVEPKHIVSCHCHSPDLVRRLVMQGINAVYDPQKFFE